MSDEPRRVFVGTFPTASEVFIDGVDPLSVMIADAIRKDDLAKAEAERARLAALASAATDDQEEPSR